MYNDQYMHLGGAMGHTQLRIMIELLPLICGTYSPVSLCSQFPVHAATNTHSAKIVEVVSTIVCLDKLSGTLI